jgi:hypothetical protein
MKPTGPVKGEAKTERVIEGLGYLDRLLCASSTLGELAQLTQAQGPERARVHGR